MAAKSSNFVVVVVSASGTPAFFGDAVDNFEEALTLQKNALAAGWKTAAIIDAYLDPVTEKRRS